jgi:hypothetical protein
MVNSNFISDSELTSYINSSIGELYDIMIQSYGSDYFISTDEYDTVASQEDYSLPTDFYKLKGVDAKLNNDKYFAIKKFNFNERNRFDKFGVWSLLGIANIRYRLLGSNIRFTPVPDNETSIRLWYVPVAPKLSADTDTLNDFNGYHEYVIVDAAIKMLQKEESDVSVLLQQKLMLKRRLEESSQNRDAGVPESVSDIYAENDDYSYWTSKG